MKGVLDYPKWGGRVHKWQLESRRVARLVESDADRIIGCGMSSRKRRARGWVRAQPMGADGIHHLGQS